MTPLFVYPTLPHVRRHGPRGYADYPSYRPWLRDEFAFRCVCNYDLCNSETTFSAFLTAVKADSYALAARKK